MPAVLGYWKLRGLGQHIRLLLEYTGTDYTDKRYEILGSAPNFDSSQWLDEKFTLGLDLPNLPYYIDGPHKITQSNAIMRYIARKHNLCGKTEEEKIRVDMIENQAMDMKITWAKLVYNAADAFEESKPTYLNETLPALLKVLNDFIGSKKWFAGDDITFADFAVYEILDVNKELSPKCLDDFNNLRDFIDRFESLEAIKKYINSAEFIKSPLNGPTAAFGGQ